LAENLGEETLWSRCCHELFMISFFETTSNHDSHYQ
jgi:hypothetical protein